MFSTQLYAQEDRKFETREDNEEFGPWYIPSELKYGGLIRDGKYKSQFNLSFMPIGFSFNQRDGTRQFIAAGLAYNYQFKTNYLGTFAYLGETHWSGFHWGTKFEPLINLETGKIDYYNFEAMAGYILSAGVTVGVPTDSNINSIYVGLKIGLALAYPAAMFFPPRKN